MQQDQDFIKAQESLSKLKAAASAQDFAQKEKEELLAQIGTHFGLCAHFLAAREIQLVNEVEALFNQLKKQTHSQIERQLEACGKAIEAAKILLEVNPSAATAILRGVGCVEIPSRSNLITLSLPDSIMKTLSSHGEVQAAVKLAEPPIGVPSISTILADLSTPSPPADVSSPRGTKIGGYSQTISSLREEMGSQGSTMAQLSQEIASITLALAQNSHSIALHEANIAGFKDKFSVEGQVIGLVSTLAGSVQGSLDGIGAAAKFQRPFYMCLNQTDDCLYVSDSDNDAIRRVTRRGEVTTFVTKSSANHLKLSRGIAYYLKERCFFICSDYSILKITLEGKISVVAGNGTAGHADGTGEAARFGFPFGITIDQETGTMYVADWDNNMIRKVTLQGEVSTLAGVDRGYADGRGSVSKFSGPGAICLDEDSSSLVIGDYCNGMIRRLDLVTGEVTTLFSMRSPSGISITPQGSFIVSSRNDSKILFIKRKGDVYEGKTIAGSGREGWSDGEPLTCEFNKPWGVCYDERTNICYVIDIGNHKIRKFSLINMLTLQ